MVEKWYHADRSSAFANDTLTFLDRNMQPVPDEPATDAQELDLSRNSSLPLAANYDYVDPTQSSLSENPVAQASPVKRVHFPTPQHDAAPLRGETSQVLPEPMPSASPARYSPHDLESEDVDTADLAHDDDYIATTDHDHRATTPSATISARTRATSPSTLT